MAGSQPLKTVQIRLTIDVKIKDILETEARKKGLELPLYLRIELGQKAAELVSKEDGKKTD